MSTPTLQPGLASSTLPGRGPFARAEQIARRVLELAALPMRSDNHPTWDPVWRRAIEAALAAIGTGDEQLMEQALSEIERLAETL